MLPSFCPAAVWDLLTRAVVQGAVTGDVTLSTALPEDIKSVRLDAGGDVKREVFFLSGLISSKL